MRTRTGVRLLTVLAVAAAACSSEPDAVDTASAQQTNSDPTATQPFTVDRSLIPDRFELVAAGPGNEVQLWGSDSFGNHSPFLVLDVDGLEESVLVVLAGYANQQGMLSQSMRTRFDADYEQTTIDGAEAIISRDAVNDRAELGVIHDDETAILVEWPDADVPSERLVDLVALVEVPADQLSPPTLTSVPDDLTVAGAVAADVPMALDAYPSRHSDRVPGSSRSHGLGWVGDSDGVLQQSLSVVLLPGAAGAPELALIDHQRFGLNRTLRAVGDDEAAWVTEAVGPELPDDQPGLQSRELVTSATDGSLVLVKSSGPEALDVETLLGIAESVEVADEEGLQQQFDEAYGGPGLVADAGTAEIIRGKAGDLEWLLQARGPSVLETLDPGNPADASYVDPCLKLDNRRRVCAQFELISTEFAQVTPGWRIRAEDARYDFEFPRLVIVVVPEGETIRATVGGETFDAPLTDVPGSNSRAGVIMLPGIDDRGLPTCPVLPAPAGGPFFTAVHVLDADGEIIDCVA